MDQVKIKKETKRKIKVDFERAPLAERLKAKFLSTFFLWKVIYVIFRTVLLVGVSFVILYPYITTIFGSFMSDTDFKDVTVILISKNPTWDQYRYIITQNQYFTAVLDTFLLSLGVALIQTLICALIAYGLAKFKFRGNNLIFFLVIFTMMVPRESLKFMLEQYFVSFGTKNPIGALITLITEKVSVKNTIIPIITLSLTGLGFKNGLFIFMLRQFFRGVPDELEESAYVDGSNTFRTFFTIILPLSVPMLLTVFIFAFAWQWTDDFYTSIFFDKTYWGTGDIRLMSSIVEVPEALELASKNLSAYQWAIKGTAAILIVLPLIIAYLFVQNKLVQGIERSGIVG